MLKVQLKNLSTKTESCIEKSVLYDNDNIIFEYQPSGEGGPIMADGSGKGAISGSQLAMGIVNRYSHNTFYLVLYW